MNNNNLIIQLIKYAPAFFILLISIFTTYYVVNEHLNLQKEEETKLKQDFIKSNKEIIQTNIDDTVSKYIKEEFENSEKALKKDLKERIDTGYKISMNIYNKNKDTLSKKEITKHIKDELETLRFDEGRGYYFIYDLEGTNIFHPIKPEREGKNFFNAKDRTGTLIVQESINIAKSKEKEGFQKWFFNKPNDLSKEYEKIGFIKKFEPYNWYIGTGIYLNDFKNQMKEKVLNHLSKVQYKNDEYIFVLDYKSNILLSKDRKLDGINLSHAKDIIPMKKKYKDFVNSKEKSEFIDYKIKNDENKLHIKEAYLRKIESLEWVVGTGFNLDEVNSIIKKEQKFLIKHYNKRLTTLFITLFIITVLLLILSYYVSKYIEKRFFDYEKALIDKEKLKYESMLKELRKILDNLPMMIIYKDTHNNIVTVNQQTADSLGKSIKELTNVASKDIFPQDYKKYYSDDLEIIKSKKSKIEHIEKYESKNGTKIIKSSKIPLFNKNGDVENIVLFMIDITEKENLRVKNEKQEQIIYQQSKFVTMGEMIANIAHQWKQPLSTITVAATGLKIQKEMNCLGDKEFLSAIDAINDSAQYLTQTIEDFRNFFKPTKNQFTEVSIVNIINKTLKLLSAKFNSQSIEIISNIKDIEIKSRENALMHVLINILNNARDELIKKHHRKLIFINSYEKDNSLIIEIIDNAGGILNNNFDKIFDAYFTTKEDGKGTGIGLYMSKDIISKLLNGNIIVENETYIYKDKEYTGAKFSLKLPM